MTASLAVVSAALVGVIGLQWRDAPAPEERSAPVIERPARIVPGRAAAVDPVPAALATILARPLFEPGRRPVAGPIAAAAAGEGLPRLTGVLITPGGRSAIFAGAPGARAVVATEGSQIGSFVVQTIDVAGATVLGPDGVHSLRPTFDPNRPLPVASAGIGPRPDRAAVLPSAPFAEPSLPRVPGG